MFGHCASAWYQIFNGRSLFLSFCFFSECQCLHHVTESTQDRRFQKCTDSLMVRNKALSEYCFSCDPFRGFIYHALSKHPVWTLVAIYFVSIYGMKSSSLEIISLGIYLCIYAIPMSLWTFYLRFSRIWP